MPLLSLLKIYEYIYKWVLPVGGKSDIVTTLTRGMVKSSSQFIFKFPELIRNNILLKQCNVLRKYDLELLFHWECKYFIKKKASEEEFKQKKRLFQSIQG